MTIGQHWITLRTQSLLIPRFTNALSSARQNQKRTTLLAMSQRSSKMFTNSLPQTTHPAPRFLPHHCSHQLPLFLQPLHCQEIVLLNWATISAMLQRSWVYEMPMSTKKLLLVRAIDQIFCHMLRIRHLRSVASLQVM